VAYSIVRKHTTRAVAVLGSIFALAVLAGCATERSSGVSEFYRGDYAAAKAVYQENLKAESNSRALYYLRLGTLELNNGNVQDAREDFLQATEVMQNFKASGQFKALVGHESSKEYKGDPYEQMMALWYLGVTDYMIGAYNMALPSFKSAALADGGTTDERYRSDAASVFLMMAKAYQAMGDQARANDEYRETEDVYTFQETVDRLTRALSYGRDQAFRRAADPRAVDAAYGFLAEGASAGATQSQDPSAALGDATDFAMERLQAASKSRSERSRLLDQDPNVISGSIKDISAAAATRLSQEGTAVGASPLAPVVQQVSDGANNFVVLVGIGAGPFKYQAGEYGEMAKIGHKDYPERYAEVFVDGQSVGRSATIEDIYYQASTRGGRAMDAVLRGKAVFKDVTKYGGIAALGLAALSDNRRTQEAALITGLALLATSLATQPGADVRSWETLPDKIQILAAHVPPGRHDIEVRFYNASAYVLGNMTLRRANAEISPDRDTLIYARFGATAMACACDGQTEQTAPAGQ